MAEEIKVVPGLFGQFYLWYSDLNPARFSGASRYFLIVANNGDQFWAQGIDSSNTNVSGSLNGIEVSIPTRNIALYEWFDVYSCNNMPPVPVTNPHLNASYTLIGRYVNPLNGKTLPTAVVEFEQVGAFNPNGKNLSGVTINNTSGDNWMITGLPLATGGNYLALDLYFFKTRPTIVNNSPPTNEVRKLSVSGSTQVQLYGSGIAPKGTKPWVHQLDGALVACVEEFFLVLYTVVQGVGSDFSVTYRIRVRRNVAPEMPTLSANNADSPEVNTPVATILTYDPNEFDTVTVAKTAETKEGSATNYFSIVGNNQLIANAGTPPGLYTLTITANDGIATSSATFNFNINGSVPDPDPDPDPISINSFTAMAVSENSVQCRFYMPDSISEDATISWQRSAVDPESDEFDPGDWVIMETTDF